jgi:hypothetical protein
MATTFAELTTFLDDAGLNYDAHEEHNAIAVGFRYEPHENTYRDADGDPHVQLIVRLVEDGEFVVVFTPRAWNLADCDHVAAVCEAAARIQARLKLVRFDLQDDGTLQPNIEIPLEKAPLCAEQLRRAIAGVFLAIRSYDRVIRQAMATGEVDLDLAVDDDEPSDFPDTGELSELADRAGGLDALEKLLGGDDAAPAA